jgi:hypothetical protein
MHMFWRQREIVRATLLCPRSLGYRQDEQADDKGSTHAKTPDLK